MTKGQPLYLTNTLINKSTKIKSQKYIRNTAQQPIHLINQEQL